MFWPVVLPFQLTIVAYLVLAVGALILQLKYGFRPRKVVLSSCLVSVSLFIPSCIGIELVVDLVRFGKFSYDSATQVKDRHVRIPASATQITLFKWHAGHDARFAISNDDLMEWLQDYHVERDSSKISLDFNARDRLDLPMHFRERGWPASEHMEDLKKYNGPRAQNGGGFDVWYSRKYRIAYLYGNYW